MKKITISILILLIMSGCSNTPPPPPEPTGEFTPVNPDEIHISTLEL
jgi:hypothetical protein